MIIGLDIDDVIFNKTSEALKNVLDECEDEEILSHKLDIMRGDAINSKDKAEDCRKNNVNLFVDDSPKNCLEVQQKLKIPVIGFESDITREEMIRNNIRSVSTWVKLLELINQICSKKDNMEKF